ncbi:MAG TPA: hypothetical protein VFE46_16540 [Pirellulales bacterium]|nr:hypothetical protein [Pirellulales bacterium]
MTEHSPASEGKVVQDFIAKLAKLTDEGRQRVMQTVATFYSLSLTQSHRTGEAFASPSRHVAADSPSRFSDHVDLEPKEFIREKHPTTDVERVACLAYYLSHYRNLPHFKTLDISTLNTEAAQPKFSNPSVAISNALRTGYLAESSRGHKQISAAGENFVMALPDREAAKHAMDRARSKRKKRAGTSKKS